MQARRKEHETRGIVSIAGDHRELKVRNIAKVWPIDRIGCISKASRFPFRKIYARITKDLISIGSQLLFFLSFQ